MEEWKKINNFPDYEVSSAGRVKSLKWGKERILKPLMRSGYKHAELWINEVKTSKSFHRLVAEAFIPNQEDKREVDHINRIRTDNRVENLRWATTSENQVNTDDRSNKLGHRNIYLHTDGFDVDIHRGGKRVFRKWFKTLEEAIKARDDFTSNH